MVAACILLAVHNARMIGPFAFVGVSLMQNKQRLAVRDSC